MKMRQVRLGHSSPQTTLKLYAHILDEADAQAAARLGQCLVTKSAAGQGSAITACGGVRHLGVPASGSSI